MFSQWRQTTTVQGRKTNTDATAVVPKSRARNGVAMAAASPANADNLLKSHGKGVHLIVRPYRFGAKRVHLFDLSLKGVNDS